ncbi:MAG: hypothetical protein AVDCRST_MAG57-3848, partial [uncultured Blastococcus sp.]
EGRARGLPGLPRRHPGGHRLLHGHRAAGPV